MPEFFINLFSVSLMLYHILGLMDTINAHGPAQKDVLAIFAQGQIQGEAK